MWVVEGIAKGFRPWFAKFSGVLYDHRWLPVDELYAWHHRHERYLRNTGPVARVALVYSEQTRDFYGGAPEARVEDHLKGMYHALVEARVPVRDGARGVPRRRPRGPLSRSLVLPNVAALSEGQCGQLAAYVARGGSLVATFETSLYDEWGDAADEFGLRDVFGVSYGGQTKGRMQNSYLALNHGAGTHPLLAGLEDAPRIINGTQRVHVRPLAALPLARDADSVLSGPADGGRLSARGVHGQREVYLREPAAGASPTFLGDLDRTFWEVLAPDHGRLLAQRRRLGDPRASPPVTVTGARPARRHRLAAGRVADRPPREPDQSDGDEGPDARAHSGRPAAGAGAAPRRRATGSGVAHRGHDGQWRDDNGWIALNVPQILDHEVVAIDLA